MSIKIKTPATPAKKRRYPMPAIEQMLVDAGYEISRVNKRYLLKKGGVDFHPSPDGFQWYELYRFCIEHVLGRKCATADPARPSRRLSKLDQSFLIKLGFYIIKHNTGYLLVRDDSTVPGLSQDESVVIFMTSSNEDVLSFTNALRKLKGLNLQELPIGFTASLKLLAKKIPEAVDIVEFILGFEYKPLFKVTELSRKLLSRLSMLRCCKFKFIKPRCMDKLSMSQTEIDQLISDGLLIQEDRYVSLGALV